MEEKSTKKKGRCWRILASWDQLTEGTLSVVLRDGNWEDAQSFCPFTWGGCDIIDSYGPSSLTLHPGWGPVIPACPVDVLYLPFQYSELCLDMKFLLSIRSNFLWLLSRLPISASTAECFKFHAFWANLLGIEQRGIEYFTHPHKHTLIIITKNILLLYHNSAATCQGSVSKGILLGV